MEPKKTKSIKPKPLPKGSPKTSSPPKAKNAPSKSPPKSPSKQIPKAKSTPKPKVSTKKYNSGITLVVDNDENTSIDEYYERKMNGIIKRIKDQNQIIDDKIRFGWNS